MTANLINNQALPGGDGSGNLTEDGTATTQIQDFDVISDADTTVPNPTATNQPDGSFEGPQVKRGNKFFGTAQRILDNPLTRAYGKVSSAVVAGAGVVNAIADQRAKRKAEEDLRFSTMADNIYGLYDEQDGDRGLFDVNTGLYQPDNLRGYAMMGQEVGMESKPQSDVVDLDYKTITKLISAGADIEIL